MDVLIAVIIVTSIVLIFIVSVLLIFRDDNFYSHEIYPELKIINDSEDVIIEELKTANNWTEWPEKELTNLKPNNKWTVIPLYAFGSWSKNCEQFPETVKLMIQIPNLKTAGFSKLGPGTELTKHQGWAKLSNYVLRCHYGLEVPDNCFIYCNGELRQQLQSQWLIFDDSKIHTAVNNSNNPNTGNNSNNSNNENQGRDSGRDRIVLILDIKRPWWVIKGKSDVQTSNELENFLDKM